jgi:hypothetical protein
MVRVQGEGKIIVLRVAFDYNKLTFKPTGPPDVSSKADLYLQSIDSEFERNRQGHGEVDTITSVAVVIFKDYILPVPFKSEEKQPDLPFSGDPWYKLRTGMFDFIELTSSTFARWDNSLQQRNIELQLEAIKTHKDFEPFLRKNRFIRIILSL